MLLKGVIRRCGQVWIVSGADVDVDGYNEGFGGTE